jgi:hypothetical protein
VSCQGACGRIVHYPLVNPRAHTGALGVNELIHQLEVVALIRIIMGSCTDDLFQHTLVKSLQRLDKARLEIKEKQYEAFIVCCKEQEQHI